MSGTACSSPFPFAPDMPGEAFGKRLERAFHRTIDMIAVMAMAEIKERERGRAIARVFLFLSPGLDPT